MARRDEEDFCEDKYAVLKMKEDARVAYMTANELKQCQELADTEKPHQKSHKLHKIYL